MSDSTPEKPGPLSAQRLRQAFSRMLGKQDPDDGRDENTISHDESFSVVREPCEISPKSITEALLFVGRPENKPFTARELAAAMRNVSPREVEEAIEQLNADYEQDGSAFEVVCSTEGYRVSLRDECQRVRDNLSGRGKEAKLSQQAIEVLALVAYHQPISLSHINKLRQSSTGNLLSPLVRRKLIRMERTPDRLRDPSYCTTDRFLSLLGIRSLDDLPRSQELDANLVA